MRFLTYEDLEEIQMEFGTPSFVYDEATLPGKCPGRAQFPQCLLESFPGMR